MIELEQATRSLADAAEGIRNIRILFAAPQFERLRQAMASQGTDATYILASQIAKSLQGRGHSLTFLGGDGLRHTVLTSDPDSPAYARHRWTATAAFEFLSRASWKVQRALGVPYLNVFSNLRLCDAVVPHLPRYDVVYERNGIYRDGVARACRRTGTPYVLFVEADEIEEHDRMGTPLQGLLRRRAALAFRYNLQEADLVVCVSEVMRQRLIDRWSVHPNKVSALPNGVDVDRFRPDPVGRHTIRTQLGLGERPVVAFIGSFYVWHDVGTLLRAFVQVIERHPDALLLLVGEGNERQRMEQLAAELRLEQNVRFTGAVPHDRVPAYLAAADVATAPYAPVDTESWMSPLKAYESMSSGTPVVASAVGQLRETIHNGIDGLLVTPGQVGELAAAISQLLLDPAQAARIGTAARSRIVEYQSLGTYSAKLEQLLYKAIDNDTQQPPAPRPPS
jgi:glycosyltransferase involved in cell wall biosynthesis